MSKAGFGSWAATALLILAVVIVEFVTIPYMFTTACAANHCGHTSRCRRPLGDGMGISIYR